MTDNSSGQLPPEGRLTDDQRARMRAGLMTAAREPSRAARPWLVPAAAAASVALLVATATLVGLAISDGDDGQEVSPAGQGTSSAPTESVSTIHSSPFPTDLPEPTYGPKGQKACDQAVPEYLPGATKVAEQPYGEAGTTYLYATDTQWVICDTWATQDGGPPTVTGVHAYGSPLAKELLLISQNFSMTEGIGAQFFAAGAPIPDVKRIQYSFPDGTPGDGGHLVDATMTEDLWVMQYLMPDPPGRAWTEPVKVAVVYEDGSEEYAYLTEMDLCAQVNHGC